MASRISDAVLGLIARLRGEDGQALGEYAIILGLVFVVAVAALTALGIAIAGKFDPVSSALGGGGSA